LQRRGNLNRFWKTLIHRPAVPGVPPGDFGQPAAVGMTSGIGVCSGESQI